MRARDAHGPCFGDDPTSAHGTDPPVEGRLLTGGGDMGERIRTRDWSETPLGPIESWPPSLQLALGLILNARMPMWLGWGPECRFFYNDAYVQVLSESKHPWALGRPAAEVWAEIWDICGPLAEAVFRDGEAPFLEDVRLFMDRGDFLEEVYYSFSYSPIRDGSGSVVGLFCPNTEVTAKILHARRLRTLSELATNALVEKTTSAACASAAATLAGNPDDLPFALLYLADPAGSRAELVEAVRVEGGGTGSPRSVSLAEADHGWPIREVFQQAVPRTVEVPFDADLPLGPAERPVREAMVLPISAPGHERPFGVLVAGINPTRPLDAEYATFYELVSAQVATALQEAHAAEQERQRLDRLAEVDRAKTAFFSNVSHEFRTPLTLMLGPTEDALGSPERALRGEALETVYRNELRLLKLVNALLDFSRIEAGRMAVSYELVDLGALTADLASGFRSAIERTGLRFDVRVEPLSGPVRVDRDLWEKIVLNLLSNALKFTLEGEIRVRVGEEDGRAVLEVSDTGTGIPSQDLPRLFERFHRIENPRARTHEGSGIGLALVQDLTRIQGGTVSVESEVGRGTTFRVALPVAVDATVAPTAPRSAPSSVSSAFAAEAGRWEVEVPSPQAGQGYVLLADDNADMRSYVARLLAEHWPVVAVADGLAAVEAALRAPPDLVLTDVMMPGLDGFGVLAALRAHDSTRGVPVILLSARAGEEARVEGLSAGADDYLIKPFSARELVARVRTHLTQARMRRRAEQELEELFALLAQVPAAITVRRGPELRCVFQNASSRGMYDLMGTALRDVWPEQAWVERVEETARTGTVAYQVEAPVTDPGGTRYWDVTWAPMRQASGSIDGVISIGIDVTERVVARRRQEVDEERRRLAFEAAGAGAWRIDLATDSETRDAAMNRLLGLPEQDGTFPSDSRGFHPDDRAAVQRARGQAVRTGAPLELEVRVVRPDGAIRWVRDVGRVVCDEDGRPIALTGASVDVTARREAEAEREAAQERLRAALDASAIGTYLWNVRTDEVMHDEGVKRLFGFGPDDGDPIEHYTARVHPEDRQRWLDGLAAVVRDSQDFEQEYRIGLPDGTERWLRDKGRLVRGRRGQPDYVVGAVVDITVPRQLAQAAQEASRAKDEFLAMLGHELRNPLAPIATALQLMRMRDVPPTRELQVIERQVRHLTRLVDDLLDISRITRGLVELKTETLRVSDLVAQALEITSPVVEQYHHHVSVLAPRSLWVSGDPVRLAQVLANLLTNAARYTPSGGSITVTAALEDEAVVVRVEDNGQGIPSEKLAQIFEPFVRGTGGEGGLGIGLALSRSLARLHGGDISVSSEGPGRGSQFAVRLPPANATEPPPAPPEPEAPRVEGRRVLLVDDNADAADLLSEVLRGFGHSVVVAYDGPQAIERVRTFEPEVAVLDIGLPVMDGYELARRLREGGLGRCRLIALTGYGQEQDRARSRDAGFDVHLVKPVDVDVLTAALRE
jgi:PAS domain S-box-containing protein